MPASQPIEAAVVALTKIVSELAGKKKSEKASSLEAALDKAEGFGPSVEGGLSSSSGRSKAAAHRLLKETLVRDFSLIYGAVERLLEEDLLQRRLGTCLQDAKASARAWLEYRSNLGPYPTMIRLTWQICGIWDALREGKVAEARARAALAVAACDQQSLDSGSWILAEQFCLRRPFQPSATAGNTSLTPQTPTTQNSLNRGGPNCVCVKFGNWSCTLRQRRSLGEKAARPLHQLIPRLLPTPRKATRVAKEENQAPPGARKCRHRDAVAALEFAPGPSCCPVFHGSCKRTRRFGFRRVCA